MNESAGEVRHRAGYRCEYCRIPEAAFRRPFHIEHIVAKQHGGSDALDNRAGLLAVQFEEGPEPDWYRSRYRPNCSAVSP